MGSIEHSLKRDQRAGVVKSRIGELDALRGFALAGIHVVNIYQQVVLTALFSGAIGYGIAELPDVVRYGFYERFLPIFTLLFGVSFGIFTQRAAHRTDRPRVVLVRRLTALLVIGATHFIFHPGEVLTAYAVLAFAFLLPATYLRPRAVLAVSAVLLLVGAQTVPGFGVMPGLLLLGYGLTGIGAVAALPEHPKRVLGCFTFTAVLTIGYLGSVAAGWHLPRLSLGPASLTSQLAGVTAGVAYASGFLLLLRTRWGGVLSGFFAPMGRMALTNYLAATVMFLSAAPLMGIEDFESWPQVTALTFLIVVAQAGWSRWWLRRFTYGPVEWLWRCVTWWERVRLRRV